MAKRKRTRRRRAAARPVVRPHMTDEWERGRQGSWKKLGFMPYELPVDESPAGQEREFFTRPRTYVDQSVEFRTSSCDR